MSGFDHLSDNELTHAIAEARLDAAALQTQGSALWRLRRQDALTLQAERERRWTERKAAIASKAARDAAKQSQGPP